MAVDKTTNIPDNIKGIDNLKAGGGGGGGGTDPALQAQVDALIARADAEPYSLTLAGGYQPGEMVSNGGQYYVNTVATADPAGAFNPANWDEIGANSPITTLDQIADSGTPLSAGKQLVLNGNIVSDTLASLGTEARSLGTLFATKIRALENTGTGATSLVDAMLVLVRALGDAATNTIIGDALNTPAIALVDSECNSGGVTTANNLSDGGLTLCKVSNNAAVVDVVSGGNGSKLLAFITAASGNNNVTADGDGALLSAYVRTDFVAGGTNQTVSSGGRASFLNAATIAKSATGATTVDAGSHASFVNAFSNNNGGTVNIKNTAKGALMCCSVNNAGGGNSTVEMPATAQGSMLVGASFGGTLMTQGSGSLTCARVVAGEVANCTGNNSAQIGVGVNSRPDSLKVGDSGIEFLGKQQSGTPGSIVNGSFWVDDTTGDVMVMTGGLVKNLTNIL